MPEPIDPAVLVRAKLLELFDSARARAADGITFVDGVQLIQELIADGVFIIDALLVPGADKKAMILKMAHEFYDAVIAPLDLPYVPKILAEPALDRLIGNLIDPVLGTVIEAALRILRSGKTLPKKTGKTTGSAPVSG